MLLRSPISRRRALRLGAAGLTALLAGCRVTGAAPTSNSAASTTSSNNAASDACLVNIPGETAGPYPGDGSRASNQTLNALTRSGIVRADIRTSTTSKNVALGVPLSIELTLVNTNKSCAPLTDYAIYAWHCTRDGLYSMYSNGVIEEDFLRGVQATDSTGKATFMTVFPGCYLGRWPHVHFEIYAGLDKATAAGNVVHTSQLALPEDVCTSVYASAEGYSSSVSNLKQITLATDNVFSDGTAQQMATVTGDAAKGYVAKLTVGVGA